MSRKSVEVTPDVVEGEMGLPGVNQRKPSSAKKGIAILFMLFVLLAGAAFLYFSFIKSRKADAAKEPPKEEQISNAAPARSFVLDEPPAPPPPPEAAQEAVPAIDANQPVASESGTSQGAPTPVKMRPTLDKSADSLMVMAAETTPAKSDEGSQPRVAGSRSALQELLDGRSDTAAETATHIGDRNMRLSKGSMIECALQTRLDTTVPGMASCLVVRDVYSDNGKVLLIERGSQAIGEYSGGLKQGMNRIFVLWTRVTTPHGVTIELDSPGTDPLGASGLGGKINNHFWQRFGAAMLLSLVDDLAATASRETGGSGNTISYGNSADAANNMAAKVLEQTVNIPPTLYKDQGDRINIFVARDLDFGGVYGLRPE